ncbi:Regulator of chromosome condensation (RCC1) repeat-containing protein [Paenibacillus sp. 453mf]|nr:Regulator of chromosome condensation (RCC1) repeat-containing protein [Paenibacillus sp. 453mf]
MNSISSNNIIVAGRRHTVGVKSDGTVKAVGDNNYGQCIVSDETFHYYRNVERYR